MSTVGLRATEIAELVRSGRLKPTEVVADHLRQVDRLEPTLHALLSQRPERATAEAAELEKRKDLKELPLAGVPVTIKDSVDVAGEPTRVGSLATSEAPRQNDDELVRRLRQAGCVVIGKTNQPELGIWHFTQSNLGVTRNPWNLDSTPGGSSGGAATSVTSAMVPIAQGSDGGGSIRIPAAFCGVFGIKPGPGLVPLAGGLTEHWFGMTQWGPLTTSVSDAALMLDILAGTTSFRDVEAPSRPLRLALSTRPPATGVRLNREVRLAVEASADALRQSGHTITITDPPYSPEFPLYFLHRFFAGIATEVDDLQLPISALEPRTQRMVRIGRYLNRYHPVPRDGVERPLGQFMTWFQDYDALVTPTTAQPLAPAMGWDGKGWLATLFAGTNQVPFTQAWNVLNLPAASVPAGLTHDGSPIGVQRIARRGGEELLLSLASQLEELRPWPRHAPMAAVESGGVAPTPKSEAATRRKFARSRG